MQRGGTWGLDAGQWTDDTSMSLCLASSLITKRRFDPYDQMVRYKWWYKYGFLSSTGHCFDIGSATRQALDEFSRRQILLKNFYYCTTEEEVDRLPLEKVLYVKDFSCDCSSSDVAGNGALMRLAPVPLFYFRSPLEAVSYAGRSATLTHGDIKASDACRYYAALIVAAVHGDDTDTTAAIYGQLAGAYYGYQSIPENWRQQLYANQLITSIGHWLHFLGKQQSHSQQQSQKVIVQKPIPATNPQRQHQKLDFTTSLNNRIHQNTSAIGVTGYYLHPTVSHSVPIEWSQPKNTYRDPYLVDTSYNTNWSPPFHDEMFTTRLPSHRTTPKSFDGYNYPYYSRQHHYYQRY
ncbi:unnamed protein product [Rotaria sp. Silwood1]|nr:unnamed protein product [Rotaria sp. Silwood1]